MMKMTQTLGAPGASDTTDTMRAAVVTEFGGPLQVEELELPSPGYGEALVKLGLILLIKGQNRFAVFEVLAVI